VHRLSTSFRFSTARFPDNGIAMSSARSRSQQLHMLAILPIERQGQWFDACLLCGGGRDIRITQVPSPHEAAAALRQVHYDLLIFWQEGEQSDNLEVWDQLSEITGHSGFVSLGMQVVEGWNEPLIDAGAIACLDMDQTEPVTLVNTLRMAGELERLRCESHAWEQDRLRKRERETREIDRALAAQRSLLERLDQFGSLPFVAAESSPHLAAEPAYVPLQASGQAVSDPLQNPTGQQYLAALQTFIFDENQTASTHIAALAEHYARTAATSSSIMRVHLAAVTHITTGAGAGSLRHCLAGADRFLMELLMRLVDQQGASTSESIELSTATKLHAQGVASPLAAA
jgi:hypothetical protein